ncbi:hypothetical protein SLEP1_g33090 [Rubroshorea leprosula]|uniref:Uncharacterized protein n=1 Tax=Rubroshorea leprosula TaxID=152421 RepID=A0AAV5KFL7_9ROSI|nr:hypothetical protein SLEP1_g33090 [Rubroshorea leprosula]
MAPPNLNIHRLLAFLGFIPRFAIASLTLFVFSLSLDQHNCP